MESTAGTTPPPTWFGSSWARRVPHNRTLPLGVLRLLASEGATAMARSGVQCCPNLAGDQDGQIAVHLGWRHPGVGPLDKSVDHLWGDVGIAVAELAPGRRHLRRSRVVGSSLRGSHQGRFAREHERQKSPGLSRARAVHCGLQQGTVSPGTSTRSCPIDRVRSWRSYSQSLRLNVTYSAPEITTMRRQDITKPEVRAKPGYGRFCP